MRFIQAIAFVIVVFSAAIGSVAPALALDCSLKAQEEMDRLPLAPDGIASIRYVEKRNPTERGPDVLGVRAWVRLKSCSGYLVIDMTRSCFVRQSYTRGDCRVEGVTAY
ncbi:MAG: hypothetical protein RH942_13345 [Kiloniellaceae bacterium]